MTTPRIEQLRKHATGWQVELLAEIDAILEENKRLSEMLNGKKVEWVELKAGDVRPEGYQYRFRTAYGSEWRQGIWYGGEITARDDMNREYRAPKL